jgi:hypothetical protein
MEFDIDWDYVETNPDIEDIRDIEKEWGITFPDDYIDCVSKYQGGSPDKNRFDIEGEEYIFNSLLSFNIDENYIIDVYDNLKELLPEGIYPFADDNDNNYICFDYRKVCENPPIVFWDQKIALEETDNPFTYVCESFSDFLGILYSPDEYIHSAINPTYEEFADMEEDTETEPITTSYDLYVEDAYKEDEFSDEDDYYN